MHGPRPNTTRLRVCLVGLACGLGLAVGCSGSSSQPARQGGSSSSKADKARKDAEALAVSAVTGGADAQAQTMPEAVRQELLTGVSIAPEGNGPPPPVPTEAGKAAPPTPVPPTTSTQPATPVIVAAPKSTPRPGPATVIRARVVSSMPHTIDTEADADALAQVCDLIEKELSKLDPPVRYRPSVGEARTEFIRKDSRTVRQPSTEEQKRFAEAGITGLVYVEYEVEVTANQVRELRSQERAGAALRVVGMLAAVALAGFLFLRADEWTKGYLTSWLALGAVVLVGGAAAAFIFA